MTRHSGMMPSYHGIIMSLDVVGHGDDETHDIHDNHEAVGALCGAGNRCKCAIHVCIVSSKILAEGRICRKVRLPV